MSATIATHERPPLVAKTCKQCSTDFNPRVPWQVLCRGCEKYNYRRKHPEKFRHLPYNCFKRAADMTRHVQVPHTPKAQLNARRLIKNRKVIAYVNRDGFVCDIAVPNEKSHGGLIFAHPPKR